MTAYELANALKDDWADKFRFDAADMLRQQADRIAELEKDFAWAKDQWNKDRICFESRRNELEKDLALKTRDRDVFGDFTLAYEKRIAELEETINACYTVQKMQAEEVYKGNDRIAELEKELKRTKFAWNLAENEIERLSNKDKSGNSISAEEYQKTHEGFSTIEKVIANHEAIPSRKEAIDKAREWLKVFDKPQTEPVAWWTGKYEDEGEDFMFPNTRQAHIDHPQSETHKFFSIPLYTTPQTKPLSDEEIIKIFNKIWVAGGNTNGVMHRFARAIEQKHLDNAATMLRQQADRIAELEKQSQPVAWMEYIQDEEWEVWYTKPTDLPEGHSYKPLYLAPQTKPLSDEEIISIRDFCYVQSGIDEWEFDDVNFARAIEERHGIK